MKKVFILIFVGLLGTAFGQSNIDSLISRVEEVSSDSAKIQLLLDISEHYLEKDPDSSLYFLYQARELCDDEKFYEEKFNIQNRMGIITKRLGNVDSALSIYKLNLQLSIETNYDRGRLLSYNNMGLLYRQIGNFRMAHEYFLLGVHEADSLKEYGQLSNLYLNLGLVYYDLSEDDKAIEYYLKSMRLGEEKNHLGLLPYAYNAIGRFYSIYGKSDSAFYYYSRGLDVAKRAQSQLPIIFISRSIGELFFEREEYDSAYFYLTKCTDLAIESKNRIELTRSYLAFSEYYYLLGNGQKSNEYAKKAYYIAEEIRSWESISGAAEFLFSNYEKDHMLDSALKYHKIYSAMSDSLLNEENFKNMMQLSMQYEYNKEQREKEIIRQAEIKRQKLIKNFFIIGFILTVALLIFMFRIYRIKKKNNQILRAKNRLIEDQKRSLEELNWTKDRLFGIISHDLRGPFNSMMGFTTVILQRFKHTLDPKVEKYISVINQSSRTLYDLVDRLLHWSKIKQNKIDVQKEQINLRESVEKTLGVLNISAVKKDIQFINQVDDKVVLTADPNMLSFVIRNLVSNAIKFSDRFGNIYINGKSENNTITVTVQDEGVGMKDEEVKKLFREDIYHTTKGTDGEKGSGLGLIVCKEFVEMMNGTIKVESLPGEGSSFIIELNDCVLD